MRKFPKREKDLGTRGFGYTTYARRQDVVEYD
jgi:hypothetical protein